MKKNILVLIVLLFAASCFAVSADDEIRVDQLGYRVASNKFAVLALDKADSFSVIRLSDNKIMLTKKLGLPSFDKESGDNCYDADFSELNTEGEYIIEVDGQFKSYPFTIGNDIYNKAYDKSMRAFYEQRCGTKISGPDGFTHEPCHLKLAYFHQTTGNQLAEPIDVTGGWHDAGDYGRYIVNSGISTATLLSLYERNKTSALSLKIDLPYSGYKFPDLLEEIKYNIDWMLKMQAPNGGVYSKVTPLKFPGFIMPEKDTSREFIFEITSCATADFAVVTAIAARVYAEFDKTYADKCLQASINAWKFLAANPSIVPVGGFKNPVDAETGEYEDTNDKDDRFWAAVELFNTTGGTEYAEFIKQYTSNLSPLIVTAAWWRNVEPAAMIAYCYGTRPEKNAKLDARIRLDLKKHADTLMKKIHVSKYGLPMLKADYIWGSNNIVLNFSINLIAAAELCKDKSYLKGAEESLHYIFGRNPFNMSYVTGLGSYYCMAIHHRPSAADNIEEPWPGLLAGGPNKDRNDQVLKALSADTPPMKCYQDNLESYASNEVAINWNAPLVYVLGYFTQLK